VDERRPALRATGRIPISLDLGLLDGIVVS
jgi:hypothetical protein